MNVEVHIDWDGATHFAGRLYSAGRGNAVSFEYTREWLGMPGSFAIDPTSLPLQRGAMHSPGLFGVIQDCGPDRWGRLLIQRAVRKKVLEQKPWQDLDYVLALDDSSRIGALRFRRGPGEPFLAVTDGKLPPVVQLPALLRAADAIHHESETAQDLRFLLGQGSPLGGARPKSAVALPDGNLGIAKFPKPDDTRDIGAGEALAMAVARAAGIRTADHQLVPLPGYSAVLITRFDRRGSRRIPLLSGASLLALGPDDPGSYTMLADAIRQSGDDVVGDLRELWRRMVLSLLASNYDDHLRNHAFLMLRPGRWSLSPAYDLNPVPEIERGAMNQTPITEESTELSVAAALQTAGRFGLDTTAAKSILREVHAAVADWRAIARKLRLKPTTVEAYQSAFEHERTKEAAAI